MLVGASFIFCTFQVFLFFSLFTSFIYSHHTLTLLIRCYFYYYYYYDYNFYHYYYYPLLFPSLLLFLYTLSRMLLFQSFCSLFRQFTYLHHPLTLLLLSYPTDKTPLSPLPLLLLILLHYLPFLLFLYRLFIYLVRLTIFLSYYCFCFCRFVFVYVAYLFTPSS